MPGKRFLHELLQLLPGQSVVYVADLDVSAIRKWGRAVGTNPQVRNVESKWGCFV